MRLVAAWLAWLAWLACACAAARAATDTGYPAGYMADCPGMNYTTRISAKTMKSLTILVFRPSRNGYSGGHTTCGLGGSGAACAAKYLDFDRTTKVIISGYLDSSVSMFTRAFTGLELGNGYNVLLLEIFPVLFRTYPLAARTTKPLGHLLGDFLSRLVKRGLRADRLDIMGGSLGAHIGYFASMRFQEKTGLIPNRLTGLDPAGPCFRNIPADERFNRRGARRVDALHTNVDGFGIADATAHVDFYANGGEFQPAMVGDFILPCFLVCSHVRAAWYWIAANRHPDQFIGVRCASTGQARRGDCYDGDIVTNLLGPQANFSRPGVYYLPTAETAPYYLGKAALKKQPLGSNNYLLKTAPDESIELK